MFNKKAHEFLYKNSHFINNYGIEDCIDGRFIKLGAINNKDELHPIFKMISVQTRRKRMQKEYSNLRFDDIFDTIFSS